MYDIWVCCSFKGCSQFLENGEEKCVEKVWGGMA